MSFQSRLEQSLILRVLALCAASLIPALLVNALRPAGAIPWIGDWDHYIESKALTEGLKLADLETVRRMAADGRTLLLDARPAEDFEEGHIPGAWSLPYDEIEDRFDEFMALTPPNTPLITYCSGEACDDSFMLSLFLRDQSYTNVALFPGGIKAWRDAGLEVEGGP